MATIVRQEKKEDKRKILRRHLVFYLRVFDGMSSRILGQLVNVSPRGVMLISDRPIQENQEYRLRMRLPHEIAGRSELTFEASCRWCTQDSNPDFFIAGFHMQMLPEDVEKDLQSLINDFSVEENEMINSSTRPACNLTHANGY
jgi:hypothetical protein